MILIFQFEKPGRRDDFDYPQMAEESIGKALEDAKVNYKDIQQAFVGYVYGKQFKTGDKILINFQELHIYFTR